MALNISDMYRVRTVLQGWQGAPGLNTFYFSAGAGVSPSDALAAVNRVRGCWDVVKSILGNSVTAQTLGQVDILDPTDGSLQSSVNVTQPAIVTGSCATSPAVSQVAAGLELFTAEVVNGRRLRGRSNVGPLCANFTNTVVPAAGVGTAVDAMGVALLTISPPGVPPLIVWHRPRFDPVTHVLLAPGGHAEVTTTGHATKFFSIRSRRD